MKYYRVGGAVSHEDYVYVHRPQDKRFQASLTQGNWVEVVGSRTMGKTSLYARWREAFTRQGLAVAYADVAGQIGWGEEAPETLAEWLAKLGRRLALDLDLPPQEAESVVLGVRGAAPGEMWLALARWLKAGVKKERGAERLLLVLDEIDVLKHLSSYGEQLLSTLRAFKTDQAAQPELRGISLCFIGLRSMSGIASEKGGSASQLGVRIHMTDFDPTPQTIKELAAGLPRQTREREELVRRILGYTGGQPLATIDMLDKAAARERPAPTDAEEIAAEILAEGKSGNETHLFRQIQNLIEHFQRDIGDDFNPENASPYAIYNTYLNYLDGRPEARSPQAPGAKVLQVCGLMRQAGADKEIMLDGKRVLLKAGELEIKGELFARHFSRAWTQGRLSELAKKPAATAVVTQERQRLCVFNTGGTIGMVRRDGKIVPTKTEMEFKENYRKIEEVAQIDVVQLFNLDSINVYPADWTTIARAIYARRKAGYAGFVVAHGTDTLAFTASGVAFALGEHLACPIVFTGAQTTNDVLHGDAGVNLHRACRVALQKDIKEVVVCFGASVFRACRAQKRDDKDFEGFESPNYFPLAFVTEEIEVRRDLLRKMPDKIHDIELRDQFADRILLIQQYPGLTPDFYEDVLRRMEDDPSYCRGVILQTLGAGNVATRKPYSFIPFITESLRHGVPVIITSVYPPRPEGHTEYQTAMAPLDAGAIYAGNMTAAAALTKFSWVLAQVENIAGAEERMKTIKAMMKRNYIGEKADEPVD